MTDDRPLLLDLFCGAGGCAVGYHRAGFRVVGCDIEPQPRYPFGFIQGDALELLHCLSRGGYFHVNDSGPCIYLSDLAVIHASPPCQRYSQVNRLQHLQGRSYPDLLAPIRRLLDRNGKPWIIENVEAAPMRNAIRLCGSSFGLLLRRHRLFESSHVLFSLPCNHRWQELGGRRFPTAFRSRRDPRTGEKRASTVVQVYGNTSGKRLWPAAMGIDWMRTKELTQAIPPAYTEFIGRQLIAQLSPAKGLP
jgi:DNA (cytosine-5)-methyltransferase 1